MPSFAVALPPPGARRLRPSRAYLALGAAAIATLWVVIAFAGIMAQLNEATERAAAVRAQNAELTSRLAGAQAESALLQSDAYLRFEARGFGMGEPGEHSFGLAPGAPAPDAMTPLGGPSATAAPATPLDSWLRLLFGD